MARGRRTEEAPQLRTLLIAPKSDLEYVDNEVQRVANALHPRLLFGQVTIENVLDALSSGTYDVIWFACHGAADGVILSDGVLDAATLIQLLRPAPPRVVVLNSCSSVQAATQIHDELGTAVIGTVVAVPDRDAYVTGAQLAHALSQGMEVGEAYQASRPGRNRQYVLLNSSIILNGDDRFDDVNRLMLDVSRQLHGEIAGLRHEMNEQRRSLHGLREEMTNGLHQIRQDSHRALTRPRLLAWVLGFVIFVFAYGILEFRESLQTPVWVALFFSVLFLAVSGVAFVVGLGFRLDR